MPGAAPRFDSQAREFDRRAGVGEEAGRVVARSVLTAASAGPGDVLLEIGVGTGEIGRYLARSVRYIGMDTSRGMLDVFRARVSSGPGSRRVTLVQADAEHFWPVRDRSATVVLASRVVHLLDPAHVMTEVRRVCLDGGFFLVGRVQREPGSPKSRLRRRREELLRDRGFVPGSGWRQTQRLLDALTTPGALRLGSHEVARWPAHASAEAVLGSWKAMTTVGGVEVPAPIRSAVLVDLRTWAGRELGDLDEVVEFEERYTLDGVRLGGDDPSPDT